VGLWVMSAQWHSSGVHGLRVSHLPVGMLFMSILDHLTLARAVSVSGVCVCVKLSGYAARSKDVMVGEASVS
jgi:hypothetical protein